MSNQWITEIHEEIKKTATSINMNMWAKGQRPSNVLGNIEKVNTGEYLRVKFLQDKWFGKKHPRNCNNRQKQQDDLQKIYMYQPTPLEIK